MSLYVETSSLLSYLHDEPRSEEVIQKIESHDVIVTSRLTLIESGRSLARDFALGRVTEFRNRRQCSELTSITASWKIFELTPSVCKRAGEKFPIEPVRSLDAIHLSSMLEAVELYPDLKILSFDDRILENLKMLGMSSV